MKQLVCMILLVSSLLATADVYTPSKGSSERGSIMNALRAEVKSYNKIDVVFKVRYLKVKDRWAWIETMPMSKDGKNNYEDVSALLQKKKNVWKVAELACTEAETAGCLGDPNYFRELKKKFPNIPMEIIPVISSSISD